MVQLLDHHGNPLQTKVLGDEIAAPSLTGIRTPWASGAVATGLTPTRLAAILQSSADGDAHEYLTLAEEMEEREPHYASVLGTRKRAVTGVEPIVEAASDDAKDQMLADEVRALIRKPAYSEAVDDLLDGIGKGYSVVELVWSRGKKWMPHYEWRDPRWFIYDRDTGRDLLLIDEQNPMGKTLPAFKFMIHQPRLKTGLQIRAGLARIVAASYMCKAYSLMDWMAYLEVFGMPIRIGRYGQNAGDKDKAILRSAVANIGTDAAAILPDSMRIEFQEVATGSGQGAEVFKSMAEFLDKQISKAVLGQTATTEGTPGKLGGEQAQDNVRGDILEADCKQLQNTINRDLVKPFIDLNFGVQDEYPRVIYRPQEPEDIAAMADALGKLVPLGSLGIQASVVRDKLGFPDPEEGAALLGGAPAPVTDTAANQTKGCGCSTAMNADTGERDELDELEREAASEWQAQLGEVVQPILDIADEADGFEDFLARLTAVAEAEPKALAEALARATFKARGLGDGQ